MEYSGSYANPNNDYSRNGKYNLNQLGPPLPPTIPSMQFPTLMQDDQKKYGYNSLPMAMDRLITTSSLPTAHPVSLNFTSDNALPISLCDLLFPMLVIPCLTDRVSSPACLYRKVIRRSISFLKRAVCIVSMLTKTSSRCLVIASTACL